MARKKERRKTVETETPQSLPGEALRRLEEFLMEVVSRIPESKLDLAADPEHEAGSLIFRAQMDSAAVSGVLALPSGPFALLSVLPDLLIIWKRQAQLVADIAASYGKTAHLTREAMMYCLFKHVALQAVRDLLVRAGQRMLSRKFVQKIIERIVGRLSRRLAERIVTRWIPIVGAVGVAAYAYYDTGEVGRTAVQFFGKHRRNAAATP